MTLYIPTKPLILILGLTSSIFFSTPSLAFMSDEVIRAMDEANLCKRSSQGLVFIECMQLNNEFIRKSIISKSRQSTDKLPLSKREKINHNISKKIKSNIRRCMNEKVRINDSDQSDQRHEYCLYENMLEILINIDRDVQIYVN